jgi:hypothetical protein
LLCCEQHEVVVVFEVEVELEHHSNNSTITTTKSSTFQINRERERECNAWEVCCQLQSVKCEVWWCVERAIPNVTLSHSHSLHSSSLSTQLNSTQLNKLKVKRKSEVQTQPHTQKEGEIHNNNELKSVWIDWNRERQRIVWSVWLKCVVLVLFTSETHRHV